MATSTYTTEEQIELLREAQSDLGSALDSLECVPDAEHMAFETRMVLQGVQRLIGEFS